LEELNNRADGIRVEESVMGRNGQEKGVMGEAIQ